MKPHVRPPSLLVIILFSLALVLLCLGCGDNPSSQNLPRFAGPKILVIGLDGADWDILDRLEREGRIPNLARVRREGAWGVMRAEEPLLSPVIWTSLATGRTPRDHGIVGFLTVRNGVTEPVRSDERQVRAFWNVASEAGLSVGIVGWYSTWPAEEVKGFLVSDRAGHHQMEGSAGPARSGIAFPASLEPEIKALRERLEKEWGTQQAAGFFPQGLAGDAWGKMTSDQRDTFLGTLRTTDLYRRLTPELWRRFRPEVAAVYFEGTDSVGHLFGQYAPPLLPGIDPAEAQLFGSTWDRYYGHIDTIVGELVSGLNPAESTVIIVSDHGFKTGDRRPLGPTITVAGNQAPLWHRPEGILMLWGRGIQGGKALTDHTAYDLAPTLFRLLGLPLAANLAGRPTDDAFTQDVLARATTTVPDFEARGDRKRAQPSDLPAGEEMARLKALGYIGGGPSGSDPGRKPPEGQAGVPLNRFNQGLILLNSGRLEEAGATFQALVRDAPGDPLGHIGVGLVLLRRGRGSEAIEPLERALRGNQDFAPALAYLGEAWLQTGKPERAAPLLARAFERDPGQGRAALLLAQIEMARRNLPRSGELFEAARRFAPLQEDRGRACVGLAVLAEEARQFDRAESLYNEALTLVPGLPVALERYANLLAFRGQTFLQAGRKTEARRDLEHSLALNPRQPEARNLLEQTR